MSTLNGTILVTGGTQGLGFQASLQIAKQAPDCHIVLASRTNPDNANEVINKATGHDTAEFMPLDLASMPNIRTFVDDFASKKHPPITALLLNAALQLSAGIDYSADGIEKTFAINHVGHALLLFLLRPYLAHGCRIIITSSGTHDSEQKTGMPTAIFNNAEELAHPNPEQVKQYDGRQKYSTSKLCNVLWMYALHKRLTEGHPPSGGPQWTVAAIDPGLMPGTGLARDASAPLRFLWNWVLPKIIPLLQRLVHPNIHTIKDSGAALADLAIGEKGGVVVDGKYLEGTKEVPSSKASHDVRKQEDLWNWTINAVAKDDAEKRAFEAVYLSA